MLEKKWHGAYGESICLWSRNFASLSGMKVTRINLTLGTLNTTDCPWFNWRCQSPTHHVQKIPCALTSQTHLDKNHQVSEALASLLQSWGFWHLYKPCQPLHRVKKSRIPQWNWRNAATKSQLLPSLSGIPESTHCNIFSQILRPVLCGFI